MMKKALILAAAMLSAAGFVAEATAATIKLNVSKGWTTGSHSYSNGSETVTAEAYLYNSSLPPVLTGNPYLASWSGSSGGIGVCSGTVGSGGSGGCSGDQHTVDGATYNEMVVFDFGATTVNLTGITFAYVDYNDQFDVFAFGDGVGSAATDWDIDRSLPNGCSVCFTSNFTIEAGSIFGIGAWAKKSEWKIKKIHYDVVIPPPSTTVPLPASALLLLAGLGGLGFVSRRRRRSAA